MKRTVMNTMDGSHHVTPNSPINTADKLLGKKLALRLARVDRLLCTVEKLTDYQAEQPNQSIEVLRQVVGQIVACSEAYNQLYEQFEHMAQVRQQRYEKGRESLKGVTLVLWNHFVQEFPPQTLRYQVVQVIWDRLRNQRAFPSPKQLFRPEGVKALRQYQQSYQMLSESFQLFLDVARTIGFQPQTDSGEFDTVVQSCQLVDMQVDDALARLTAAHQERIRLYEELSSCTGAIVDRIRQAYGNTDPAYMKVRYCKV